MKKRTLSLALALCMALSMFTAPTQAAFTDIHNTNTALAAATLESMGIAEGTGADSFSPSASLTRAQFCTFAVRAMGLEEHAEANGRKMLFSDVRPGAWYTGYVNLAYTKGAVNGYGDGRFGPDDSVNYAQVITILLRMLGYTQSNIGNLWPDDYIAFAESIDLDEGVSLGAYSAVTRGDAALLLCNMLREEIAGTPYKFYEKMPNVASVQEAIILDTDAVSGGKAGYLKVCSVGAQDAAVSYYAQKETVSSDLCGTAGSVLFNNAGEVVGFVPDDGEVTDITVDSASPSSIEGADGITYRIASGARVIAGGELYPYASTGYLQVDAREGECARLFRNDAGKVDYVYLSGGAAASGEDVFFAETDNAAQELAAKLGISSGGYAITKNGAAATAQSITRYDTAYYDAARKTMCVSDYRVTGFIESASPSLAAAESVTLTGCTLGVLESAWDTLSQFSAGDTVTLLLTDDAKVAAAVKNTTASAPMLGIAAEDGTRVTLCGSGITFGADALSIQPKHYGKLVRLSNPSRSGYTCVETGSSTTSGTLDITARTLGNSRIAPGCAIYEWVSDGTRTSYVRSLSGKAGAASTTFSDLFWTATLPSSSIGYVHHNSAGEVDILILNDVTGNAYDYGSLVTYTGAEGFVVPGFANEAPSYNSAAAITNGAGTGVKCYYTRSDGTKGGYLGAVYTRSEAQAPSIFKTCSLTYRQIPASDFFLVDGDWYAHVDGTTMRVAENVHSHISASGAWLSGEIGLTNAIAGGGKLNIYFDRTLSTGAQVRVVVVPQ